MYIYQLYTCARKNLVSSPSHPVHHTPGRHRRRRRRRRRRVYCVHATYVYRKGYIIGVQFSAVLYRRVHR